MVKNKDGHTVFGVVEWFAIILTPLSVIVSMIIIVGIAAAQITHHIDERFARVLTPVTETRVEVENIKQRLDRANIP